MKKLFPFVLAFCFAAACGGKVDEGPACAKDNDCAGTDICVADHCGPAECVANTECKSGACNEGRCMPYLVVEPAPIKSDPPACKANSECRSGACNEGTCMPYLTVEQPEPIIR